MAATGPMTGMKSPSAPHTHLLFRKEMDEVTMWTTIPIESTSREPSL